MFLILLVVGLFWCSLTVAFLAWEKLVYAMLVFLSFSGAIELWLPHIVWTRELTDIFFVIPIYISLAFSGRWCDFKLPRFYGYSLLLLAALVCVQMLNPSGPSWLARLVGFKVWLFYIPMLWVGGVMADKSQIMLRVLLLSAWIPCLVGILQWILVLRIGYQPAISMFYGAAGRHATQLYTGFNLGHGKIVRIPSTFSFVSEYYLYLICALVISWLVAHGDVSYQWRRFAGLTQILIVIASLLSGARAAFLFVPVMYLIYYVLNRQWKRFIWAFGFGISLAVTLFSFAHLQISRVAGLTYQLTVRYSQVNGVSYISRFFSWLGHGVGSGTNAVRHVAHLHVAPENFYAKAGYELGWLGIPVLLVVLSVPLAYFYRKYIINNVYNMRSEYIPMIILTIMLIVYSLKSPLLDYEPMNMLYWVSIGLYIFDENKAVKNLSYNLTDDKKHYYKIA